MGLIEHYKKRYSVKKFGGEISEEDLNKILKAVNLSPSSYNFQPWFLYVVKKPLIEKLVPYSYNQENVRTASHLIVFCAITDRERLLKEMEEQYKNLYPKEKLQSRIEMLRTFLYNMSDEELFRYVSNQVFIALGFALSAAAYYGIDSCPIGGFSPKDYKNILNIPKGEEPVVVLALGKAADKPKPKVRKNNFYKIL